jgi:serine/threonine-protein kinase HipA
MTKPLVVSINGVRAGLLQPRNEGSIFELDEEYLDLPNRPVLGQIFEDDPNRPHRTRQGVPPWFANLLPEGPLRQLIAERANVHESRSLFLLNLLGDDLPGAVAVHGSDGETIDSEKLREPAGEPETPFRFSLAGVQMKFSAIREGRSLTIPAGGSGGDWIIKLPDQRFAGVPENEFSMMEFARDSGLDVPKTQLLDVTAISNLPEEVASLEGRAFAVRRFDRTDGGRIHIEDFAQVLDIPPTKKYGATNFDTIARVIKATCAVKDTDEFIRRLVFMIAIGNSDAHAKNWSLIYPDGRSAHLAPAYDLVAVSRYEAIEQRLDRELALKLGGVPKAEKVNLDAFRRLGSRAGLDKERVTSVVNDEVQAILKAWELLKERLPAEILDPALVAVIEERLGKLPLFRA